MIREACFQRPDALSFEFLQPWFEYHNTFAGYSHAAPLPFSEQHVAGIALPESTTANQKV